MIYSVIIKFRVGPKEVHEKSVSSPEFFTAGVKDISDFSEGIAMCYIM